MKKWELIESSMALDERWFRVRRDTVKLPNGLILDDYFVWLPGEISMVVAITAEDEVVLVKQYKHGYGDFILECPAGMIDEEEDGLVAAKRELLEETGYEAKELIKIGSFSKSPSKATNYLNIFLATDVFLSDKERHLDETEDIEVLLVPFKEVFAMMGKEQFLASDSIAAIYLAAQKLGRLVITSK